MQRGAGAGRRGGRCSPYSSLFPAKSTKSSDTGHTRFLCPETGIHTRCPLPYTEFSLNVFNHQRVRPERQHARARKMHMTDMPPYPGTPPWVKMFGGIAIVLIVLAMIAVVTGHGPPGRHLPGGVEGGHTAHGGGHR